VTLETVDVERLARHPLQPRKDLGDLTELTESIREEGILQPIVTLPDPTGTDRLFVLFGHRRWAAAIKAGLAEVPVLVRHDPPPDGRQLVFMLAENIHREGISPVEEAGGYRQLEALGYTPERITRELGRRRDTVERRLALSRLPGPVLDGVHAGQISIGDADDLAEFADDADAVGRLTDQIGTPNYQFAVQAERRRRRARAAVAERVLAASAAGVPVLRPATRDWLYAPPEDGQPAPLSRLDVDDHDEHQVSCPGRVLVVYPGGEQAVAGCVEPSRHGLFVDAARGSARGTAVAAAAAAGEPPGVDGGQEEARAAAAEADLQLQEDLAVAAEVRDAWIREKLLSAGVRPDRAACTLMLRQALLAALDSDDSLAGPAALAGSRAGDLLGLPFDSGEDRDAAAIAWGERLRMHLEGAPLERLVQLAWALLITPEVGRLTSEYAWTGEYGAPLAARHLADLQALGYIPCDVEMRMLAGQAAAEGADG
jgi:ParB family chromosome partitioning protein